MAEGERFRLNASIAGVGKRNEVVTLDRALWADYVEHGLVSPIDDDGDRLVEVMSFAALDAEHERYVADDVEA